MCAYQILFLCAMHIPLSPQTTDLFLQGKRLTAAAALDYGLVTETVPAERFEERARTVAKSVASQSIQVSVYFAC